MKSATQHRSWIFGIRWRTAGAALVLVRDAKDNLYGITYEGADQACSPYGCGTVFKVDKTGKETVLYSFTGTPDGSNPYTGYLVRDKQGNLYGTTQLGGAVNNGTVFKVDTTGKETALYSFTGGNDGAEPYAGLVRDAKGNLYGTTASGGASGLGTVFKVDANSKETVLHSFTGAGGDGAYPWAELVRDAQGNLYGTTASGGASNNGTVFRVNKKGKETVLYSFTGTPDGASPLAGLVRDKQGNLYGTTNVGGAGDGGTVFEVDTTGKETVLHSFVSEPDGLRPYAGLVRDAQGNLYGTTALGGNASNYGTVFKVAASGSETVLYRFTGPSGDGEYPYAGLVRDAKSNLYGTTFAGGDYGYGTVFKLTP